MEADPLLGILHVLCHLKEKTKPVSNGEKELLGGHGTKLTQLREHRVADFPNFFRVTNTNPWCTFSRRVWCPSFLRACSIPGTGTLKPIIFHTIMPTPAPAPQLQVITRAGNIKWNTRLARLLALGLIDEETFVNIRMWCKDNAHTF